MLDQARVGAAIIRAAENYGGFEKPQAIDLACHMSDIIGDLETINRLYSKAEWTEEDWDEFFGMFFHLPDHLAAGHVLMRGLPLEDRWGLGAVQGTGEPSPDDPDRAIADGVAMAALARKIAEGKRPYDPEFDPGVEPGAGASPGSSVQAPQAERSFGGAIGRFIRKLSGKKNRSRSRKGT